MSDGRSRLTALADQINSNSAYKLNGLPAPSLGGYQSTNTSGYVSKAPARPQAGPSRSNGTHDPGRSGALPDNADDDDIMIMDGPPALPPPRQNGSQPVFSASNGRRDRTRQPSAKPQRLSKPYFADDSKNVQEVPDWLDDSDGEEAQAGGFVRNHQEGSGSGTNIAGMEVKPNGKADYEIKQDLKQKLAALESEMDSVEKQIEPLEQLHSQLSDERMLLMAQIDSLSSAPAASRKRKGISRGGQAGGIDYMSGSGDSNSAAEGFEWSTMMKHKMKQVWGINSFRLCQEGVCNANMDGRDILCVMPTGGGKSLTYQLPALLSPGTTIVISPLISLINDQVMHLREAGVECVMLTGATSTAEQNDAFKRMSYGPASDGRDEIKLCYVTPEKVAKSKRFSAVLESLNSAGRLARIVIDEAHCCSQLGHDFRPDYKKLSILKNLFPNVPILATATLSHKVLPDLLKILRLPPLTDGKAANGDGTVYFTAPLYRKNLHYSVVAKPSNAKAAIESMAQYITAKHPGKIGIVYCLSKKDTETVAEALHAVSNGAIKTGVYHADIPDAEKQDIHRRWSRGKIHCVCATIAFGLGIDCPATEYVLHHSLSKSMDGYYQETGRAGRDGRDADCVLFYRGQDATRLSSLTLGEVGGQEKVYEMLRYAQDLKTCRKVSFAKYFATSASLPSNAWDDPEAADGGGGGVTACGHCDNCTRDPSSISTSDVTLEAWRIVRVAAEVAAQGGRVTVSGLADLVRGLGGGQFPVVAMSGKSRGKVSADKGVVTLHELCEGKVTLSKEQTESLLIDMVLQDYLKEDFHPTAYSVNVYIQPGGKALRLSRQSKADIEAGRSPISLSATFPSKARPEKKVAGTKGGGTKRKRGKAAAADADAEDADADRGETPDLDVSSGSELSDPSPAKKAAMASKRGQAKRKAASATPDIDIDDYAAILAIQASGSDEDDPPPRKKASTSASTRPRPRTRIARQDQAPSAAGPPPLFDLDSDDLEEVRVAKPMPTTEPVHRPVKTSAAERWAREGTLLSDDLDS